jgi:putative nucleotidyltransferase with HDIG domain
VENVDSGLIRSQIDSAIKGLPALPTAVVKVLEETAKPDPSSSKIEEYISADQAIASKLLRVVNSAYYGLSRQVTSISQAIVILGNVQVRNLTLGVGAASCLASTSPDLTEKLHKFWLHSFATGSCAVKLGNTLRLDFSAREILFTAGLLHDIGRLFMYSNFYQMYEGVFTYASENGLTIDEAEVAVMGMNHAEIGGYIATKWSLPESLINVITHHEDPSHPEASVAAWAVHCADTLTKHYYGDAFDSALSAPALAWLKLDADDLDEIKRETEEKTQEAAAMFNVLAA